MVLIETDGYSCIVCWDLLLEPMTLECTHSLCKGCYDSLLKSKQHKCPLCRAELTKEHRKKMCVNEDLAAEVREKFADKLKELKAAGERDRAFHKMFRELMQIDSEEATLMCTDCLRRYDNLTGNVTEQSFVFLCLECRNKFIDRVLDKPDLDAALCERLLALSTQVNQDPQAVQQVDPVPMEVMNQIFNEPPAPPVPLPAALTHRVNEPQRRRQRQTQRLGTQPSEQLLDDPAEQNVRGNEAQRLDAQRRRRQREREETRALREQQRNARDQRRAQNARRAATRAALRAAPYPTSNGHDMATMRAEHIASQRERVEATRRRIEATRPPTHRVLPPVGLVTQSDEEDSESSGGKGKGKRRGRGRGKRRGKGKGRGPWLPPDDPFVRMCANEGAALLADIVKARKARERAQQMAQTRGASSTS